jgi:hypothetical protein
VDRRTRNVFAVILVVVIAVTGGAALILGAGVDPDSGPPENALTWNGVVVAVDARALTDVRSFDLRTPGGTIVRFELGDLRNGVAFPPGHLSEHVATATPILVWYRIEDGVHKALWLEDAPIP